MSTETYADLLQAVLDDPWELHPRDSADVIRHGQKRQAAREAIQVAADEPPADHVRAIPVRRLVAEAPALPPLQLPRLTEKTMNGERIKELLKAGPAAALVQTVDGLSIEKLRAVEHNDEVIVLADWHTAAHKVNEQGEKPSTFARTILQREQQVHRLLQAAS